MAKNSRAPHDKVYGLAAARAVMHVRPDEVIRIAHTEAVRHDVASMLREAASRRIAYEERSPEDLENISGSKHHEGICLAARPRRYLSAEELARVLEPIGTTVVALDGVVNPHNLGAIVRTAAFLGADGLLLRKPRAGAPLPSASIRTAEGGAEYLRIAVVDDLAPVLASLAGSGVAIMGTDAQAPARLEELSWPPRVVLVLGAEATGLSSTVRAACTQLVSIRGTGAVDSLNVSVAAGIVLSTRLADVRARLASRARPNVVPGRSPSR